MFANRMFGLFWSRVREQDIALKTAAKTDLRVARKSAPFLCPPIKWGGPYARGAILMPDMPHKLYLSV